MINSARGRGTMLAVDCHTVELRSKLIKTMMNKGLLREEFLCFVTMSFLPLCRLCYSAVWTEFNSFPSCTYFSAKACCHVFE